MSVDTIVFIGVTPIHTPCDRTRAPCPTNNHEGGGVWSNGVVGPFFFEGNVTSDNDLQMLEDSIIAELEKHSNFQTMLWQQEGAPPHDGRAVREYLDIIRLPNGWVVGEPSNGQRGLLILLGVRFLMMGNNKRACLCSKTSRYQSSQVMN